LGTGLLIGLSIGLFAALIAGLNTGLTAAIDHALLRFWLWQTHTFPWNVQWFLDDATARILLKRSSGGYSFTHQLLLDYFADLDGTTTNKISV